MLHARSSFPPIIQIADFELDPQQAIPALRLASLDVGRDDESLWWAERRVSSGSASSAACCTPDLQFAGFSIRRSATPPLRILSCMLHARSSYPPVFKSAHLQYRRAAFLAACCTPDLHFARSSYRHPHFADLQICFSWLFQSLSKVSVSGLLRAQKAPPRNDKVRSASAPHS